MMCIYIYVPVASFAGAGVPPMVWVSPWKAQATPSVMLATSSSAYSTKHTSWKERRPCERHHTTHTMRHTSHVTDKSAYTRRHAPNCYTPCVKKAPFYSGGGYDHGGVCLC